MVFGAWPSGLQVDHRANSADTVADKGGRSARWEELPGDCQGPRALPRSPNVLRISACHVPAPVGTLASGSLKSMDKSFSTFDCKFQRSFQSTARRLSQLMRQPTRKFTARLARLRACLRGGPPVDTVYPRGLTLLVVVNMLYPLRTPALLNRTNLSTSSTSRKETV